MCENCTQHGEGKAWYLEALEYGEDLLADLDRQRYIQEFFARQARLVGRRDPIHYLRLAPTPLRPIIRSFITRRLAVDHYGQAVTIEEVEQIFSLVHGLVRVPCVCRRITRGFDESCCLGFCLPARQPRRREFHRPQLLAGPWRKRCGKNDGQGRLGAHPPTEQKGLCPFHLDLQDPLSSGAYATAPPGLSGLSCHHRL